ncbi:MAG: type III secretion system chaperone [Rhabdochlamydiaceae bacterium]|nr:type III secretion system chaperone [Rhabdochlamydiaceae bacterium]
MSYQGFLIAMSQLACKPKASFIVQGQRIILEEAEGENRWNFSTVVFRAEHKIPEALLSSLSPMGKLRLQTQGPYLKIDEEDQSVHLIYPVEMQKGKFLPFRAYLSTFLKSADEWKQTLCDFEEKQCVYVSSRSRSFSLMALIGSLLTWMRSAAEVLSESIF